MSALFVVSLLALPACHARSLGQGQAAPRAPSAPVVAAHSPKDLPPAAAAPAPSAPLLASQAPQRAELGAPESQFVVRDVKRGQLLLASSETSATRLLAAASGGLLQPRLGWLWLRQGTQLRVLDLHQLDAAPVTIADGLPAVDRFSITGASDSVETQDGCDLASIALDWSAKPNITSELEDAPQLRMVNAGWLHAQRHRPLDMQPEQHEFEAAKHKARLPRKLLACDVDETCGAALGLGQLGIELVLVRQAGGGDCVHVACLLHDPKTKLYATPPYARAWGPADKTSAGTCGPYMFDRAQSNYLVGDQLCKAGAGCTQLAGPALGWLEPGDSVGAPGIASLEDE